MTPYDKRPNVFPWPPVIYATAILLGALSGYFCRCPGRCHRFPIFCSASASC
jgi:hypothetical protein